MESPIQGDQLVFRNEDITDHVPDKAFVIYDFIWTRIKDWLQEHIQRMIERIQNKHLYQNYQIKKNSIDTKNGTKSNEKRLFHGTESGITETINLNGFNRAYAGSNAALLGKGTYFADEAIYSADDTYSKPDTNGNEYMYLARVLTGIYCVGNSEMIAPPAKNPSNPTDLYDSITDNASGPSVFMIFNDVQAYPEYLITFTKFIK
ncbi:protein mono-ADP-ribosyltransferase PARP15-like [Aquarana catesbeiana]|uniref:protein mono-ADP-ribosyltransferase PARP15-like n=1 Tax=Aquarana catesbeiana TaxID=8400 RepID=UPI003CCA6AA4